MQHKHDQLMLEISILAEQLKAIKLVAAARPLSEPSPHGCYYAHKSAFGPRLHHIEDTQPMELTLEAPLDEESSLG